MYVESYWYSEIVYFVLFFQCPLDLDKRECRSLKLKAMKYFLIDHTLYWRDLRGMLLRCLEKDKTDMMTTYYMEEILEVTNTGKLLPLRS